MLRAKPLPICVRLRSKQPSHGKWFPLWCTRNKAPYPCSVFWQKARKKDVHFPSLFLEQPFKSIIKRFLSTSITVFLTTDNYSLLDSEDDYRTDSRNVSHQQQFFSELHSPGRSHYTNYWYSWVQTIYFSFPYSFLYPNSLTPSPPFPGRKSLFWKR